MAFDMMASSAFKTGHVVTGQMKRMHAVPLDRGRAGVRKGTALLAQSACLPLFFLHILYKFTFKLQTHGTTLNLTPQVNSLIFLLCSSTSSVIDIQNLD